MKAYLFVHFKEKKTPNGEQVYFSVSMDGFNWEVVNDANPVLWSFKGDKGVRDCAVTRSKDGKFYIIATDLSLAYGMPNEYKKSWQEISRNGSKSLMMWESDDLINWSQQKELKIGNEDFGCLWAPDITYDKANDDYIIHWSSSHVSNDYGDKGIYYTRTSDFKSFSKPEVLYRKEDGPVIDSCMIEVDDVYYMFVKSERNPERILMLKSDSPTGTFDKVDVFDEEMSKLEKGMYEAPLIFKLNDGRWCLMLDYYGVPGEGQGYVPFLSDDIASGIFKRSDEDFSFPYGFKHGTVLEITMQEYERIKNQETRDQWTSDQWG